jgi:hypothetical protein
MQFKSKYRCFMPSSKLHLSGTASNQQNSALSAPKYEYEVIIYDIAQHVPINWITNSTAYMERSLCRFITRPEHLIGRHSYLPANWMSFVRWSPDQWVSQCFVIECYRSFYCALFCVFMTRVSPISLCAEHRAPVVQGIFSPPRRPHRLWAPPSLLSKGYGGLFPRW